MPSPQDISKFETEYAMRKHLVITILVQQKSIVVKMHPRKKTKTKLQRPLVVKNIPQVIEEVNNLKPNLCVQS